MKLKEGWNFGILKGWKIATSFNSWRREVSEEKGFSPNDIQGINPPILYFF